MSGAMSDAARLTFETTDGDAARDQVARSFAEHDLAVHQAKDLSFRLDLAVGPRMSVGLMSYGAAIEIDAPPMRSMYHVNLPLSGHSSVRQGSRRGESHAGDAGVAFLPTRPLGLSWSADQEQYVLKFRTEELETHAAKLTGRGSEAIEFDLTFDLTSGPAQALMATVGFVHAELARPGGIATMPTVVHEMESALMTQLLMVVPSQLTPLLHRQPATLQQSRIRAILDLIDEDPSPELTTVDLAAHAGVSVRALQVGFQEVVGMSPTAYLRGVRLDRVHYELLTGAGSVTDVATRWGFYHPGRFAQQYRDRFGTVPSQTRSQGPHA